MDQSRHLALSRGCLILLYTVLILHSSVDGGEATERAGAVRFVADTISNGLRPHSRLEFSSDGRQIFWSGYVIGEGNTEWMFTSTWDGHEWTVPEIIPVNGGLGNGPALSPDGERLFFGAERPLEVGGPPYVGIWYADREGDGWTQVQPVEATLDTTGFAGRPSLSRNGNLYYLVRGSISAIPAVARCRLESGLYLEPELIGGALDGEIVLDPWIHPDEEFLLIMLDADLSDQPNHGSSDLFIVRKRPDDSWGPIVNLGSAVNTKHFDRSPSMSHDGEMLFFIRAVGDIFVESDAHFYWQKWSEIPRSYVE